MEAETGKKKRRKWPIVLLVIVLLIGGALAAAPFAAYRIAEKKLLEKEYDTARMIFETLGEFRDSSERIQEIFRIRSYEKAAELLEAGEYDAAYAQFLSLGDYLDSEALLTQCTYRKALSLLCYGPDTDHEKVAQAREMLISLGNYGEAQNYLAQFRVANTYLSRAYVESGEELGAEPLWYDAQGRLTGRGTIPEQYAYDAEGRLIYDVPDRIEYDEEGRILRRSGEERTITYTYDKKGNEISRTYYYVQSKKTRSRPVRFDRKYSGGLLTKESFYDNDMLWTVNLFTYDEQGRLMEHTVQSYGGKPYSTDQTYRYTYNEDGTLHQKVYIYPDPANSYTETSIYGYIWVPEAE